jgi:uroporphyrinogen decarboxylase
MNDSREVIDAIIRRRPAARVGVHDSPWGDTLRLWLTQGMPADKKGNPVDVTEHFGFDMARAGGWFDFLPKIGVSEVIEETAEWKITRNGAGAVLKHWKNKSGTPEHIDFAMASPEIWDRDYRPHLAGPFDRARLPDLNITRERMARQKQQGLWTFYGQLFIWEIMRCSMGDYVMYMSLIDDPEWVHDFARVYMDLFKKGFGIYFEEVGLPDGIWIYEDLGYKGSLFCNPKLLEELIFPYYRELVEFFHAYDLPVVLHTCGFTEPALDLIVSAGFDALNPMEAKAGNDALRIARLYGDRLAFVGGLDARILESGDRDIIRRGVTDLVEGMKRLGASYVFGSDHSISTLVRYEDFRFALDVYRGHMMNARKEPGT